MRAIFTIGGLLLVVLIVGVLAKKQLSAGVAPVVPGTSATAAAPATPQQQVQQFKNAAEAAMQQPRAVPDEGK